MLMQDRAASLSHSPYHPLHMGGRNFDMHAERHVFGSKR